MTEIVCKRCGGKTISKGYMIFATEPHRRKSVMCKECGHTFAVKEEIKETPQNVAEAGN